MLWATCQSNHLISSLIQSGFELLTENTTRIFNPISDISGDQRNLTVFTIRFIRLRNTRNIKNKNVSTDISIRLL